MRIRNVLAVLGAATLMAGAGAPAAVAGTGTSAWCDISTTWVPGGSGLPTVGFEVTELSAGRIWVIVCLSDTSAGRPGNVGGAASVEVWPKTAAEGVGADFLVKCLPDGLFCAGGTSGGVRVNLKEVEVEPNAPYTCALTVDGSCVVSIPKPQGAAVDLNNSSAPLATVTLAGVTVTAPAVTPRCAVILDGTCT